MLLGGQSSESIVTRQPSRHRFTVRLSVRLSSRRSLTTQPAPVTTSQCCDSHCLTKRKTVVNRAAQGVRRTFYSDETCVIWLVDPRCYIGCLMGASCTAPQAARRKPLCGAEPDEAAAANVVSGAEPDEAAAANVVSGAGISAPYPRVRSDLLSVRSAPTPCTSGMKIRPRNRMLKISGVPPLCATSTSPNTVSRAYSTIPA
jgi:hypothetical protein